MKYKIIRFISLALFTSLLVVSLSFKVSANTPEVPDTSHAEFVYLYNTNTQKVIYSKNSTKKIFPGSAVKIMTGLIACETLGDRLNDTVIITEEMLANVQGNNVKLRAGMRVTVEDLLYGVLCGGGNDASQVVATLCSGDNYAFVQAMNAKAKSLGMKNTFFTNPTGLDDEEMYSTLSDIIILAREAANNPLYLKTSSAVSYVYKPQGYSEEIKFSNRNALLNVYSEHSNRYASGLIAGSTTLGGECVITYAQRKDTGYICAVMNADRIDDTVYSYKYVNDLLDYAFSNFSYVCVAKKGTRVCVTDTSLSLPSDEPTWCVIKDDVYTLTSKDIDVDKDLKLRHFLHNEQITAPSNAGAIVGGADILYNDEIVGKAVLVLENDVQASNMLVTFDRLKSFFTGRFFLVSVFLMLIGFIIYLRIDIMSVGKKSKKQNKLSKKFY